MKRWIVTMVGIGLAGSGSMKAATTLEEAFETPEVMTPQHFSSGARIGSFAVEDIGPPVTLLGDAEHPGTAGVQVLVFGYLGDGGGEVSILTTLEGLAAGSAYRVSLDYSSLALPQDAGDWAISVSLDEERLASVQGRHEAPPTGVSWYGTAEHPWRELSAEFIATGGTAKLRIAGDADAYPVIDNVRVVAVPEPNALGALGLGLVAVCAWIARNGRCVSRLKASPCRIDHPGR